MLGTNREVCEKNGGNIIHMAAQLETNAQSDFYELLLAFTEGCRAAKRFFACAELKKLNKHFGYYLQPNEYLELSVSIKKKYEVEDFLSTSVASELVELNG